MVLAGAFYPNYFTGSPPDEAQALRELAGKDPCTTVMVSHFNIDGVSRGLLSQ